MAFVLKTTKKCDFCRNTHKLSSNWTMNSNGPITVTGSDPADRPSTRTWSRCAPNGNASSRTTNNYATRSVRWNIVWIRSVRPSSREMRASKSCWRCCRARRRPAISAGSRRSSGRITSGPASGCSRRRAGPVGWRRICKWSSVRWAR